MSKQFNSHMHIGFGLDENAMKCQSIVVPGPSRLFKPLNYEILNFSIIVNQQFYFCLTEEII